VLLRPIFCGFSPVYITEHITNIVPLKTL
jgi:hypothetical protein